jgi:hypothetical protein
VTRDPVAERRARIARWVKIGKRCGYGSLVVAIAAFATAYATRITPTLTIVATIGLVASWFTLLPAIVVGYAVRKAEREDPLSQ